MTSILESIDLEYTTISLRNDGIVEHRFIWDKPYEITAEKLVKIDNAFKTIGNNKPIAILVVPDLYGSITPEARKVNMFKESDNTIAIGLVIQSLPQRLLANFYFKINKPVYPVKFFKNETEATNWLYTEIRKSQIAC